MFTTYNYISVLRKQNIIKKKKFNVKILFFFNLKTSTKLNIVLNFLLLKTILTSQSFKFNIRNNIIYFTFNDLLQNKEWLKYFLKNKYLKKKIKKLPTLFFLYNLKLLNNYRKVNYNLFFYNMTHNFLSTKYHLLFK